MKEGSYNQILQGLLPHQWNNLSNDSPNPDGYSYESVRGELKTLSGNFFKTENKSYSIFKNPNHYNDLKVETLKSDLLKYHEKLVVILFLHTNL